MDLLTSANLEQLTERGQAGLHVSLFIPTHPVGEGTQTDPIRWKNLLSEVESALQERGVRSPDIAELLAPAQELLEDHLAWQYMSDGLAMFLRPGWYRTFRVAVAVPEVATIGDRFVTGPLLPILTRDSHFLLLALSQAKVRLLEGSFQRVEELQLPEVPTSLRSAAEPPEGRTDAMAFPLSSGPGRSGSAVFYGHGAIDENFKSDQVHAFVRQVAEGLRDYLIDQDLPMVLVGLDEMLASYRGFDGYPHVTEDTVRRNPDEMSLQELHAAAWPIVEDGLDQERAAAIARFAELHGTGRATNDLAKIEEAARHGRVEKLFLATEPWCWDDLAHDASVVQLGTDDAFARCERLDQIAVDTLAARGRIYTGPVSEALQGEDVAAIFRY